MRRKIVVKLFLLTTVLCTLILAVTFIGQTIFFQQFYANRKVNDLTTMINSFEKEYSKNPDNIQAIQRLEQDYYREQNIWITVLDGNGNLRNVNDFYLQVHVDRSEDQDKAFSNKTINVPLYNLMNMEDVLNKKAPITTEKRVAIYGVKKDKEIVPYVLGNLGTFVPSSQAALGKLSPSELEEGRGKTFWENQPLAKEIEKDFKKKVDELKKQKSASSITMVRGTVTKVHFPDGNKSYHFILSNSLFMERIRAFQANLLLNNSQNPSDSIQVLDYEQNDIKYKLFIKPVKDSKGATTYIFSMASLQPVDEAVQMVKDYYIYMIAFVLLLIILASFYYSKKIARPLLQINNTTKKIASLDFSEQVPITSKDEIGDLSQNINSLSSRLHSYIEKLQQDIEKEKQLEDTRKEFISGVSHELKTPLSIMKSCISILKDGVASHKKEYYFKAMEKEVDKMDMLIVDMLELAKFESGTYKMKMEPFYIDQVIEHICEQLFLEIAKKQLNIHKDLSVIEVMGNPQRLEQVIINFVTNAIHYTPEKGDIFISMMEAGESVKVSVENKGAHIAVDQLDKIWDRFYRGDSSRQRSNGGTGLGLAISKNILELHGVKYGVTNTENGVLFFFYLNKKM